MVLGIVIKYPKSELAKKRKENPYYYYKKNNIDIDIEVDGGINLKTAPRVKNAGANILVAGTAILMASDYKVIIDELKEEAV